ncbi:MAG: DUF72 domain-containing protein [Actinomycetota bacterium]|nr:DUF72 domain-containing protein [Actinomycetota bacterium]
MTLFIGTSGWAYKEWKPDFYPADVPQRLFLEHYSSALTACEVNCTFYRLQSPSTFAKWSVNTPESFRFTTKAHRRLTHSKSISIEGDRRSFFDAYLQSVMQLAPRLGALLFQFPPYRSRDDEALTDLLAALPDDTPTAFEFRHDSWIDDFVYKTIAEAGGTVCISNTTGDVPETLPPGRLAYVRLRTERYSPEARAGWLELLRREAETRDVFAFAKHEGIPAGDAYGGVGLAQWLVGQTRA